MVSDFKNNVTSIAAAFMVVSSGLGGYSHDQFVDNQLYYNNKTAYIDGASRTNYVEFFRSVPIEFTEEASLFLKEKTVLAGYVSQICYKLNEYFPDCRAVAEVIKDYEDDSKILKIYVIDEKSVDYMLSKLDDFDSNWWLFSDAYESGDIVVDVMAI